MAYYAELRRRNWYCINGYNFLDEFREEWRNRERIIVTVGAPVKKHTRQLTNLLMAADFAIRMNDTMGG